MSCVSACACRKTWHGRSKSIQPGLGTLLSFLFTIWEAGDVVEFLWVGHKQALNKSPYLYHGPKIMFWHWKIYHIQDKQIRKGPFLYVHLTDFHTVYLWLTIRFIMKNSWSMGIAFLGVWCDGLVVTLVWVVCVFFSVFLFSHCSCLPFSIKLGINFLIVCTKYKINDINKEFKNTGSRA